MSQNSNVTLQKYFNRYCICWILHPLILELDITEPGLFGVSKICFLAVTKSVGRFDKFLYQTYIRDLTASLEKKISLVTRGIDYYRRVPKHVSMLDLSKVYCTGASRF